MRKLKNVLKSDLGKSISSGYLLFFINNIVALFLTPYMLQFISKEEYGLYVMCVDFLAWVGFLEFGTNKVIESKAGHLIAKNDFSGLNRSFNTSFFFQFVITIVIFPVFYFLMQTGIKNSELSNIKIIIVLFSISAALSVFRSLFSSVIVASKKIHLDNRIMLLNNVLNYVLVLLLVPFVGILGLAIINVLTVILVLWRSINRIKSLFPDVKVNFKYFEKEELKKLISMGIYFSFGSIATLLLMKIDSYIIGLEFGYEQVAIFYITIKLFTLAQKVFQMLLNNFRPHLSHLFGKNDFEQIHTFYNLMLPLSFTLLCVGISIIMIINEFFVGIWVGDEFFLSNKFSILFGFWIFLELTTIISRLILISSLDSVKEISFFRIMEAIIRIAIIIVFLPKVGFDILPLSSILACFFFGNVFFHIKVRSFFMKNTLQTKSNVIVFLGFLLISMLILLLIDKLEFFPIILLFFGLFYCVFLLYNQKSEYKKLIFLIK